MTTSSPDARAARHARLGDRSALRRHVEEVVNRTPVIDVHTHLYAPEFGGLNLSGIDELLTCHYLVAETFRAARVSYEGFWGMGKPEQADLVWRALFVEHTPVSEAARGVVTVLDAFGLDTEQLSYKWKHSRRCIAGALTEAYGRLLEGGRAVTRAEVERDVTRLFSGNFRAWVSAGEGVEKRERQAAEVLAAESF